jgi:hypothetical protein
MLVRAESYFFETREAQEAADLMSIECDLKQVEACADLLGRSSFDEQKPDPLRFALIDSCVIRYRRCFTTGLRLKLARQIVERVAPRYVEIHDFFFDLGNKHIAHSVSALENPCAVVHVDARNEENPQIVAHGVLHLRGDVSDISIVHLRELCVALRENHVGPEMERLLKVFEEQVVSIPSSRIKKLKPAVLPVNLTKDIGARRWRAS